MADDKLPRITISKEERLRRFDNLRKLKLSFSNKQFQIRNLPKWVDFRLEGKHWIILIPVGEYEDYNFITHHWIDHLIVQVTVGGHPSPADYWRQHSEEIRANAQKEFGSTDDNTLRQVLYSTAIEATAFRPSTAVSIYRMFNAQKVLDFSSGWGDRLVGAMAADLDLYVGVDPNEELVSCYQGMIDFFGKHRDLKGKYVMEKAAFEKWDSKDYKDFDLVFTSPPYFDFEVYNTEDPNQSIQGRNLEKWFSEFLMVSMKKSLSLLKSGGMLALNVNDIFRGSRYVMAMLAHTELLCYYVGCIAYSNFDDKGAPKNPQPIWIFRNSQPGQPKFANMKNSLKQ